MSDEIIEELHRIKYELACEVNYDVHVLCQQMREQQVVSRERIIDRSTKSASSAMSPSKLEEVHS